MSSPQFCDLCGTDASEWIEAITIDGSSTLFDTPGGNVGGCLGFVVFDAYVAVLNKGASHSFTLTPGFAGAAQSEYWKIWIDLNQDGDFDDPGDLVYTSGSGSTTTVSGSFFIPFSATTGPNALRVAMRRGSPPPDCGNYNYGQVLTYSPIYVDECDISFTNACAREYIQQVALNSINNISGCGASGYQDFTNISTTLNAGEAYPVTLTPGFFGAGQHPERWLIWIDFNKDYDFDDPGEKVFDSGSIGSSTITSGTISIPLSALSISTRMRIKMIPTDVNTVTLNPCDPVPSFWFFDGPDQYGEAEDYTVIIKGFSLEVEGGFSAESLVKDVLVGGNCFDISNVTFSGNGGQIGKFSKGITNIGFNSGIILATGEISVAPGPNDQDGASAGFGNVTPDDDLTQLTGNSANFDLADIEFDITPTQTPLTFEYVFASEEYCEYVGSQFTDAFGFFISGPGINGPFNGADNIAVFGPGTYVGVNNVNHITNSGLYTNNTPVDGILCGQTASNWPAVNEVQFDGFTKKLTAVANVIPCETYHVKLKICDIGDGIYDSAVFLKAGSFNGGGNASVNWVVNGEENASETYEGCGAVQLVFHRVGGNINAPLAVSYQILGTATQPVDYSGVPFTIVIPPGQNQVAVVVNIVNDLIAEGQESITIKLTNACSCQNPDETLLINDLPNLDAIADTVTICGAGVAVLNITPLNGVEPYTYNWSFAGQTDPQISPFVSVSTNYKVTVTDACGRTIVRTARVIVTAPPTAQLLPPAPQICPGGSGTITVNFNGIGPFSLEYTLNGDPQNPINDIHDDPFTFSVNQPGLYQIAAVIDSNGCAGPGQGALSVTQSTLALTGVVTNASCNGDNNGVINTTVTGGQSPYNYNWTPSGIGNNPDPSGLAAGNYMVTVLDGLGCTQVQQFTISAPSILAPSVVSAQGVNCANSTGGSIDLNVTGGTPNYTYAWAPGGYTVQDPQGLALGNYTVTVTDANGCTKTTTTTITGDFTPPLAVAAAPNTITCANATVTLDGNGSSTGPGITYNWTTTNGLIVSGAGTLNPVVSVAGAYTLVVTNTMNGCTAAKSVQVNANLTPPTANGGPGQTLSCTLTTVTLNGTGSSQGPNFAYQWTTSNGGNITSGANTLTPTVNQPGVYTLVVTNTTNGCTSSSSVTVNANLTPPIANGGSDQTLSCAGTTATLNGSGSQGPNFTYQWTASNGGTISSGGTTLTPIVSSPGTYTLIVTNTTNGCTSSDEVIVNDDPNPLSISAIVSGNTITVLASGGAGLLQYSLNGTNFQYGNQFFNVPNGTYTVTVKDVSGCTATSTVMVCVLSGNVQTTGIPCYGGTSAVLVTASCGTLPYEYQLGNGPWQSSNLFIGLVAGTYTATVRDADSNTTTASFTIDQPAPLGVTATVSCNDATLVFSGGTIPYSFTISPSDPDLQNLPNGSYQVTATDSHGCTALAAFAVDVPPLEVSYTTDSVLCYGGNTGSVTAMGLGGCPPYTYSLIGSPYLPTDSFPHLSAGTYPLSVKDSEGTLSPTAFVTVFQPTLLELTATLNGNTLIAEATGGTLPYLYILDGNPSQSSGVFIDPILGDGTIMVMDAKGCIAYTTIGTVEPTKTWGLTISPNPSTGLFVLTLQNAPDVLRADVFDVTGRLLQSLDLLPIDGQLTTTLDLGNLPQGTYLLRLMDGQNWGGVRLSKVSGQ